MAAKERRVIELQGLLARVDTLNGAVEEGQSQLKLARSDFARLQGARARWTHTCARQSCFCSRPLTEGVAAARVAEELAQAHEQVADKQAALEAARGELRRSVSQQQQQQCVWRGGDAWLTLPP